MTSISDALPSRRFVVAPDSFKGCLSAPLCAKAIAYGLRAADPAAEIVTLPMADGGEGSAEIISSRHSGHAIPVNTFDPLLRPLTADIFRLPDGSIALDIASAGSLAFLSLDERDPYMTSSFGCGLLIAEAIKRGARKIIVGLGGSSTVDLGIGLLQALGAHFMTAEGKLLTSPLRGADLPRISAANLEPAIAFTAGVQLLLLADVDTSLDDCASVFGPQKGLPAADIPAWSAQLSRVADIIAGSPNMLDALPKGGAAGGIGAALSILPGAKLLSGAEFFLRDAEEHFARASAIITGEGSSDAQTFMGKIPGEILRHAPDGLPVYLLSGRVSPEVGDASPGFAAAISINDGLTSAADPLDPQIAAYRLSRAAFLLFSH